MGEADICVHLVNRDSTKYNKRNMIVGGMLAFITLERLGDSALNLF